MKYQLSTVMLAITVLAVSMAWRVERAKLKREIEVLNRNHAAQEEATLMGSSLKLDTLNARIVFDRLKCEPNNRRYLNTQCVSRILKIHAYHQRIESSGDLVTVDFVPQILAAILLPYLECEDATDFFRMARSLSKFKDPGLYSHLHDDDSDEYQDLERFVSESLALLKSS
jgi:hypothetical protein